MKISFIPKLRVRIIRDHCEAPYLIRIAEQQNFFGLAAFMAALGCFVGIMKLLGYNAKLHTFLRGDEDRELHDHPWGFWTLVLHGEYWEEVPEASGDNERLVRSPDAPYLPMKTEAGNVTIHRPCGSFGYRPPEWKHRVTIQNPCVTLVFTRERVREWGFWTVNGWVPWFQFRSNREC